MSICSSRRSIVFGQTCTVLGLLLTALAPFGPANPYAHALSGLLLGMGIGTGISALRRRRRGCRIADGR